MESRSSFSDPNSPIPFDEMVNVTICSETFSIKKFLLDCIPKGKLLYKRETNTFVQCYANGETKDLQIEQFPQKWIFSFQAEFIEPAHFSEEFLKVQKYAPRDFSQYYRFVTGYQIYHKKNPISFQTFLEMHNGDRMHSFFMKYLAHLQRYSIVGTIGPDDWNMNDM